jgi:hypothetical protein
MSLWTKIPIEIIDYIIDISDPLTQFLNDHGAYRQTAAQKDPNISEQIWKSAFVNEWQGDINLLPCQHLPSVQTSLTYIQSREMYYRYSSIRETWPKLIHHPLHVPLRHCWHDVLADLGMTVTDLRPFVIEGLHLDYFNYMSDKAQIPTEELSLLCIDMLLKGCAVGDFNIVRYLYTNRHEHLLPHNILSKALGVAAAHGHLKIVQDLWDHEHILFPNIMGDHLLLTTTVALNGHLDVLKYINENVADFILFWDSEAMDCAAREGHLEVVKYLHQNRPEGCTYKALCGAAGRGYLEVVKYLCENDLPPAHQARYGEALYRALVTCQEEVVEYLKGLEFGDAVSGAVLLAAQNQMMGILEDLMEMDPAGFDLFQGGIFWAALNEWSRVSVHQLCVLMRRACNENHHDRSERSSIWCDACFMEMAKLLGILAVKKRFEDIHLVSKHVWDWRHCGGMDVNAGVLQTNEDLRVVWKVLEGQFGVTEQSIRNAFADLG